MGYAVDLAGARWRKSSFSNAEDDDQCVEVALLPDGRVAVRDTKDRARPPHVHAATAWAAFVAGVRAGEFAQLSRD